MGCGQKFRRRKALGAHQGDFWPFCPPTTQGSLKTLDQGHFLQQDNRSQTQ